MLRVAGLSRRHVLLGAAALAVGGTGLIGRYAIGDTFESHTAEALGLELEPVRELLTTLREELGGADYDVRAAAFVAATTLPARVLMPRIAREEAVEAFIGPLLQTSDGFLAPYVLAGLRVSGRPGPCGGLAGLARA